HLGIAREVTVFRMVAPAPPDPSQRQERADDRTEVETEPEKTVLLEELEVQAVSVRGRKVVRAVVEQPEISIVESSKAGPLEGMLESDTPCRLPGLDPRCGRPIARLGGVLLRDGVEPIPETLGSQRGADQSDNNNDRGKTQAPRRSPDKDAQDGQQAEES